MNEEEEEVAPPPKFRLNVNTYVLILELSYLDLKRKTFNVWVEIGFHYDVHDYLRTFDNFVTSTEKDNDKTKRLNRICPSDLNIHFDVVNAVVKDQRSEAHFIRKMDSVEEIVDHFYTEGPAFNSTTKDYLSDAKGLVNYVDIDCPRGMYWKHETRTFNMELTYQSTERLAPFDQIHLFFKLINDNCRPGSNRVKFIYNKDESDFSGMQKPISGYVPEKDKNGDKILEPVINNEHSYSNADIVWDRLYISVSYQRQNWEEIVTFYVIPFLLYNYMIIKPIQSVPEALLGVSSTLVIANVAFLIVYQNDVFTYYEQAVIAQIIVLILSTLTLAFFDFGKNIRLLLGCFNFSVFVIILSFHIFSARKENKIVSDLIKKGDYKKLNTL